MHKHLNALTNSAWWYYVRTKYFLGLKFSDTQKNSFVSKDFSSAIIHDFSA